MMDYNLLVSFRKGREKEAEDEMVRRISDAGGNIEDWNVSMDPELYLARVSQNPKKTVQKIRKLAEHFPDVFAYTLQWIPVDEWTEPEAVGDAVSSRLEEMPGACVDIKVLHSCIPGLRDSLEDLSQSGGKERIIVRVIGDTASVSSLQENEWADINQIREITGLRRV